MLQEQETAARAARKSKERVEKAVGVAHVREKKRSAEGMVRRDPTQDKRSRQDVSGPLKCTQQHHTAIQDLSHLTDSVTNRKSSRQDVSGGS